MNVAFMQKWRPIIGLEFHCQLLTAFKLFSPSPNPFYTLPTTIGKDVIATENMRKVGVNECVHFFDRALPGSLPGPVNRNAVHLAIKAALALQCTSLFENSAIGGNIWSIFERKHYFYDDLPAGYQITQQRHPLASIGTLTIPSDKSSLTVRIKQVQIEQDTAKSIILDRGNKIIDYNRADVPLIEIVTQPDMCSAEEAVIVAKKIHDLMRHYRVCNGNMEEGAFRVDVNISIIPSDQSTKRSGKELLGGVRCEIKNLNSFAHMRAAICSEISRQISLLESGRDVKQCTLSYDVMNKRTIVQREKESWSDYRFLPDADIPPLIVSRQEIEAAQKDMLADGTLDEVREKFIAKYGISRQQYSILQTHLALDFYTVVYDLCTDEMAKRSAINWIITDLFGHLKRLEKAIDDNVVCADQMASIVECIAGGLINGKAGKLILAQMIADQMSEGGEKRMAREIAEKNDLLIDANIDVEAIVNRVLEQNEDAVGKLSTGNKRMKGWLMGEILRASEKKILPSVAADILDKKLQEVIKANAKE